jgi:hypothetical protein
MTASRGHPKTLKKKSLIVDPRISRYQWREMRLRRQGRALASLP